MVFEKLGFWVVDVAFSKDSHDTCFRVTGRVLGPAQIPTVLTLTS